MAAQNHMNSGLESLHREAVYNHELAPIPADFLGTVAAAADLFTSSPADGFLLSRIEKD
jgi:hypothetical protein